MGWDCTGTVPLEGVEILFAYVDFDFPSKRIVFFFFQQQDI